MPRTPHPISGVIKDVDNSTVLAGATVKVYDREKSDSVTANDLTDSNGAYVLDMANMKTEYAQGDNIVVEATKENKTIQTQTTISGDSQTINMTMKYNDILGVFIDLLTNNWQKERTDNIKPIIDSIFNLKEVDLNNNDYLLLYELSETDDPFALGATTWQEITGVSIDAKSSNKISSFTATRNHMVKIKEEIKRIFKANISLPARPFQLLIPRRRKDLSDKTTGLGRMVLDYDLKFWGA